MKIIDTVVFAFHPFLVAGYDIDFLSVSLLEKDNSTTCQDKSNGNKIFITPPYIYNDRDSATERNHSRGVQPGGEEEKPAFANETKLKGIVYELFNKGLKICWVIEDPESMIYNTNATEDLQQLDQTIVKKKADTAMPMQSNEGGKYSGYEYVQRTTEVAFTGLSCGCYARYMACCRDSAADDRLSESDAIGNHFPCSFVQGVMEGIWWSIVNMSAVGYGNTIPKSYLARLFGILWILIGLVLCSFFTATFTRVLTLSSIKENIHLDLRYVAVLADCHAYDEVLKHTADVNDYTDFYQMYKAFMEKREVEGIWRTYTLPHTSCTTLVTLGG
ncbi:unnamed protein product [Pocillopora meandrina]|uniref:Potassium channel domain-containing protein n=1 Tax=Pocillopora meandrina TaxID=46732 RepID=A0AAU9XCQ1_9CNID|nr:unnamed protein product [Pocillopora meandrina]